jgi:hypothetical protein
MSAKRKPLGGQSQLFPEALQDPRQGSFDSLLGAEATRKRAAEDARAARAASMGLPGFAAASKTVASWERPAATAAPRDESKLWAAWAPFDRWNQPTKLLRFATRDEAMKQALATVQANPADFGGDLWRVDEANDTIEAHGAWHYWPDQKVFGFDETGRGRRLVLQNAMRGVVQRST